MKNTTKLANAPYAVIIFGDAPGSGAVLSTYSSMADAERDRQNWMDCYSRRPDRPKASTYRRVGSGSEADLLAAIQDLAAHLTDRCVRNAIDSAVQNVLDRRNGNDF